MNCPVHGNKLQEIKIRLPNSKNMVNMDLLVHFVVTNVRKHISILRELKKRN